MTAPGMSASNTTESPLIVALDTNDLGRAAAWAAAVAPHCGLFKLGLEFFLAHGAAGIRAIAGRPVFLDLKLHDIPNTVAGAMRAMAPLAPALTTLHAAGGAAMMRAALDAAALAATGVADPPAVQVLRLARLALAAGADGLVCSPLEVAMLRDALGAEARLVVPGIRPAGAPVGDQARTMTPAGAVAAGADWIVVGRPITASPDPAAAAAAIAASIR